MGTQAPVIRPLRQAPEPSQCASVSWARMPHLLGRHPYYWWGRCGNENATSEIPDRGFRVGEHVVGSWMQMKGHDTDWSFTESGLR